MKAIIYNRYGGSETLEYVDVVTPRPKQGEVLIRIKAASVNPADWKARQGRLKIITGRKFPKYPGIEASGIVESVGPGVESLKPGDKVFAVKRDYTAGAYAEFFCAPEENCVILPENIDFPEGSTLSVAGVTALQSLRDHGQLEIGMKVLINGASGGVGTYAVQIARILGGEVTAVCSKKNHPLVRKLGAEKAIDYHRKNFADTSRKYDIILDAAGNLKFRKIKHNLKKQGVLVKLNLSTSTFLTQLITNLFYKKKLRLILMKINRDDIKWVRDQIAIGNLKVIIDKKFPLEKARKAHEYSESRRARGKIILKIK